MTDEDGATSASVKSIDNAFEILNAVAQHDGPISLKEIALRAGVSPSKAHRYLQSLCRCGLINQTRKSGAYDLGVETMRLGLAAVNRVDLINRAADGLSELVDAIGADAYISVWSDLGPTVIRTERLASASNAYLGPGLSLPMFTSSTGLIFAAFACKPVLREALSREAESRGEPITRLSEHWMPLLKKIREVRYARYSSDLLPGHHCISAPILSLDDQILACVTLVAKDGRLAAKDSRAIKTLLKFCKKYSLPKRGYFDPNQIEEKIAV
ncbi:IclR family transcriptional regulator [Hyphococcus formosus]|uniref:IclR family transcriptional regulator n=1 Tax=Hyphococcus formosus TaxID=3143534 RepID=UPI00398A6A60